MSHKKLFILSIFVISLIWASFCTFCSASCSRVAASHVWNISRTSRKKSTSFTDGSDVILLYFFSVLKNWSLDSCRTCLGWSGMKWPFDLCRPNGSNFWGQYTDRQCRSFHSFHSHSRKKSYNPRYDSCHRANNNGPDPSFSIPEDHWT